MKRSKNKGIPLSPVHSNMQSDTSRSIWIGAAMALIPIGVAYFLHDAYSVILLICSAFVILARGCFPRWFMKKVRANPGTRGKNKAAKESESLTSWALSLGAAVLASIAIFAVYNEVHVKPYCVIDVVINPIEGSPDELPLSVFNPSPDTVFDVSITVMRQGLTSDPPEQSFRDRQSARSITIGNVSNQYASPLPIKVPVSKEIDNKFQISIFSRESIFTEFLVISWAKDHWAADYDLARNGEQKWIHKINQKFPYVSKH